MSVLSTSMCHSTQTVKEWLHLMLNDHVAIDKVWGRYMLDNNDMSSPSVAIKSSDAMGFINMVTVEVKGHYIVQAPSVRK